MISSVQCSDSLLRHPWRKEILRLPGCHPVRAANGTVTLSGVRVRMGIHWASIHGVSMKNPRLFDADLIKGPVVDLIKSIADAGLLLS